MDFDVGRVGESGGGGPESWSEIDDSGIGFV